MRIVYFGTYISEYSRNRTMIAALRSAGVEVMECNQPLWTGIEDRVQMVRGGWKHPSFWLRVFSTYARLIQTYLRMKPKYDILFVGYPGHFDVFLGWLIARFHRKPLVWDVFMSIYLIACERKLNLNNKFIVNLIRIIEKISLRLPDRLIQDTSQYVEWHHQTYGISPRRFLLVPTGADDSIFFPVENETDPLQPTDFCITYYGSFIPNHGLPYVMEAVLLLKDQLGICFEFIGEGPNLAYCKEFVEKHGLTNVLFIPWLSKPDLVSRLRKSSILLGAFGHTTQSLMTVQNKIFEGLALAKPVITGDSPAVRQVLTHGTHIWLCDRNNPADLAEAIIKLRNDTDLLKMVAANGYKIFEEKFSIKALGIVLREGLYREF